MNIQMMSTGMAHHPAIMSDNEHCGMPGMMDVSMTDVSMSEASVAENGGVRETSMNCGGGSGMVHTCCTAACTIVFVPLPNPINSPMPVVYRTTITPEVASPVVHVSRDLYRPPIA